MRSRATNNHISVHAVAGTATVLLGLNATEEAAEGLLGFTILKRSGTRGEFKPLPVGDRHFPGNKESEEGHTSETSPIQAFMWSDYVVEPGKSYTYRIIPLYGDPGSLKQGDSVDVSVKTENPDDGEHGVFFNRGVAGSQSYSRRFGEHRRWYLNKGRDDRLYATPFIKPEDVPKREAYKWLSRGLEEAMTAFVEQAKGPEYSIRAAVYELTYVPIIEKFVEALESGADVKIIHHAKSQSKFILKFNRNADTVSTTDDGKATKWPNREGRKETVKDSVFEAAARAVSKVGLKMGPDDPNFPKVRDAFDSMLIDRTITSISHNKFILLLKDGKPVQVWTGSTNLTDGGIFGQSNVGHIIRDEKVAAKYHEYWKKLSTDPKKKSSKNDPPNLGMQNWNSNKRSLLKGLPPKDSITPVFSPRLKPPKNGPGEMLDWYASRIDGAKQSVFLTSAFTISDQFLELLQDVKQVNGEPFKGSPFLRYVLLEGKGGLLKDKYPIIKKCSQNRVAYGDTFRLRKDSGDTEEEQLIETLTGLNTHVNYLHTKYLLVDALTDDPIVISGSANFSDASTFDNDENMVIIRGNTRVADIFLGEFMRLFNHFNFRNIGNRLSDSAAKEARFLVPDDSWTAPYFKDGDPLQQERLLFG